MGRYSLGSSILVLGRGEEEEEPGEDVLVGREGGGRRYMWAGGWVCRCCVEEGVCGAVEEVFGEAAIGAWSCGSLARWSGGCNFRGCVRSVHVLSEQSKLCEE